MTSLSSNQLGPLTNNVKSDPKVGMRPNSDRFSLFGLNPTLKPNLTLFDDGPN